MFAVPLAALRRAPPALRLKLQVLFARAWEALTETHQNQAVLFVRRLAGRLALEDALDRYFREVAVPAAMQQTVRARALLALADCVPAVPLPPKGADPWQRLRPDRWVSAVRRRAQLVEEVTLRSRMAAAIADAAVTATHSRMAAEAAEILADLLPADEAVMLYIRAFELPIRAADAVFRGALALLADRRLPVDRQPVLEVEPGRDEPGRRPGVSKLPVPAFGLRVIV